MKPHCTQKAAILISQAEKHLPLTNNFSFSTAEYKKNIKVTPGTEFFQVVPSPSLFKHNLPQNTYVPLE